MSDLVRVTLSPGTVYAQAGGQWVHIGTTDRIEDVLRMEIANAEDLLTLPYGSILRTATESEYEPGTVWHWDGERLAEMCFSDTGANIRVTDRDIYDHDDGEEPVTLAEILPLPMTVLWTGEA